MTQPETQTTPEPPADGADAPSDDAAGVASDPGAASDPQAAEAGAAPAADSTTPSEGSEAAAAVQSESPKSELRVVDVAMRGLVLVGLGVLITAPLWCQQTGNFRRTEFLADRSAENSTEGRLTAEIVKIIERATSDQQVDELDATRKIVSVLREADLGAGSNRADVASELVATIVAQAAETSSMGFDQMGGANPQMQQQAIRGQARVMARGLITQLGGTLDDDGGEEIEGEWETISWPTLSGFEYEEGMELPATVTALDGKDVMAWGYLLHLEEDQFLLVKSLWSCCFGRPPDLHEAIVVRADNSNDRFESRGVRVYGRFEAKEMTEDGYVTSLYRLDSEHVRPM